MKNPFIVPILALLKQNLNGMKEFDILKSLTQQFPEFNQLSKDPNLQLFRQHFLIMNALYQLQKDLWQDENLYLSIHPLSIKISPATPSEESLQTNLHDGCEAKLASYYLDWQAYQTTDENEVIHLLSSFFSGLNAPEKNQQALQVLGFDGMPNDKSEIKKQYRRLTKKHHPDCGGETETFISIRQAYEQLML